MKSKLPFLRMTFLGGLFTVLNLASAQTWTKTSAPIGPWTTIASSADGIKVIAAGHGSEGMGDPLLPGPWGVYISEDAGLTWRQSLATSGAWTAVAASADGTRFVATSTIIPFWNTNLQSWDSFGGVIFRSEDSGLTWAQTSAPTNYNWSAIASSADGTKLAAAAGSPERPGYTGVPRVGSIYISNDSGETWVQTDAPTNDWSAISCSADGLKLVAAAVDGIYTSANSGTTWTQTSAATNYSWACVASSADGVRLIASTYEGPVFISPDSGATWVPTPVVSEDWPVSCACSADGSRLVATGTIDTNGDGDVVPIVFTSSDFGVTWSQRSDPDPENGPIGSICIPADGGKLAATIIGDGVYSTHWEPYAHRLYFAPSNGGLTISWLVPSSGFVLQENFDLNTTNWIDVPLSPALNFTNLNYEVTVSPAPGSRFYRLKQQ